MLRIGEKLGYHSRRNKTGRLIWERFDCVRYLSGNKTAYGGADTKPPSVRIEDTLETFPQRNRMESTGNSPETFPADRLMEWQNAIQMMFEARGMEQIRITMIRGID